MTAVAEEVDDDASEAALQAFSDKVLAEVAVDSLPRILEFHQVNRRRRANLTHQITALLPRTAAIQDVSKQPTTDLAVAGDVMDFFADVEDLLATIAVDPDAFREWSTTAEDIQLLALFAQFVGSFTSGEAKRSSI
jgi:hypothetical protein